MRGWTKSPPASHGETHRLHAVGSPEDCGYERHHISLVDHYGRSFSRSGSESEVLAFGEGELVVDYGVKIFCRFLEFGCLLSRYAYESLCLAGNGVGKTASLEVAQLQRGDVLVGFPEETGEELVGISASEMNLHP